MNSPPLPSADVFEPHVNEKFSMRTPEGKVIEITLVGVERYTDDDIQRSFSLFFSGEIVLSCCQTCRLSHPKLGEFDLSLGPVVHRRRRLVYEADFCLLKDFPAEKTVSQQS